MIGTSVAYKDNLSSVSSESPSRGDILLGYYRRVGRLTGRSSNATKIELDSLITETESDDRGLDIIKLPTFRPLENRPTESFAAMQEWEGYVDKIGDESFIAVLKDLSSAAVTETEIAEFDFSELSAEERQRLCPGQIFRWLVGYARTPGGTREGKTVFYFRRPKNSPLVNTTVAKDDNIDPFRNIVCT